MKDSFLKTLFFISTISCSTVTIAKPITYTIDPMHSYVEFHINHFGFSHPSGKWMVKGNLVLDEAKIQNSTVDVSIDVAKVTTGIPELDKHLNGADFFDTKKYPTATFVSHSVSRSGKETAIVHGTLTVRDVSKPITLKVKLNKKGVNPINNKPTLGFTANTNLQRSDFNIKTLLPGLGNEVKLDIEVEANKAD